MVCFVNISATNKLKDWAATKLQALHSLLKMVTSMLETKRVGENLKMLVMVLVIFVTNIQNPGHQLSPGHQMSPTLSHQQDN